MTPRDHAVWNAAIKAARQMAMVAAISLENRDDAQAVRQQAAAAALSGFAEGARALMLIESEPQS